MSNSPEEWIHLVGGKIRISCEKFSGQNCVCLTNNWLSKIFDQKKILVKKIFC